MEHPEDEVLEFDDGQVRQPPRIVPAPARTTPDWLTGAADGLGAVPDPREDFTDEVSPEALPRPTLRRPGAPLEPAPPPPRVVPPAEEGLESPEALAAEAAAPLPRLSLAPPAPPRRPSPSGAWAPVASSVPTLRLVLPEEPEPLDEPPAAPAIAPARGLPGASEDRHVPAAPQRPLAPLHEPWWVVALDALRTSRPVQLAAALGLVALVVVAAWGWPRGVGTTSLSELRRNPARFDGRVVTVRGRVGDDIFSVGAGWAFYLVQGRDTIVAFTRGERPKPRVVVTLKGQVSTGFLDGMPRQALFADSDQ